MRSHHVLVCCAAMSVVFSSPWAHAVDLPYRTFVGSINNFNSFGELGFVAHLAEDNVVLRGNFGAAFDNIVTVDTITIDQRDDAGRHRMRDLRIYTSPTSFVTAQLNDSQAPQTINLPGDGLTSDYLFITVESHYDTGSVDDNPGLSAFTFDGTIGPSRTNLNSFIEPTAVNQFEPENFFLDVLTNGQIASTTGGPVDALYFEHADTNERSITVNYGGPQDVASIGVGWEGQIVFSSNARPVPKFVTITDSNGASQDVRFSPHTLQYGQYALDEPFLNTTSLKLTLPVGAENYHIAPVYNPDQDTSTLTGITEFQAFADVLTQPGLDGDFNDDGMVDAADYTVWRDNVGAAAGTLPNDPNGTAIGADQYNTWRMNYGVGSGPTAASPTPEPAALAVLALVGCCSGGVRRRR